MHGETEQAKTVNADSEAVVHATEEEPLLRGERADDSEDSPTDPTSVHLVPVEEPREGSTLDLFRDPHFWVLSLWMVLIVGAVRIRAYTERVDSKC